MPYNRQNDVVTTVTGNASEARDAIRAAINAARSGQFRIIQIHTNNAEYFHGAVLTFWTFGNMAPSVNESRTGYAMRDYECMHGLMQAQALAMSLLTQMGADSATVIVSR